jgi:ribosome biogenesis protein NSA2
VFGIFGLERLTGGNFSSQIKNKRAEKAARFSVPIPKVKGISEEELFKV